MARICCSAATLVAGLLFTAALARPDDPPAPPTFRLGTWNIEWLGLGDKRASKEPQQAEDIAKYIIASGVDALGLNEITWNTPADQPPGNTTLLAAFALLKQVTGQEWKHLLFPRDDQTDKDQLPGIAWNTGRAKPVGEPLKVNVRKSGPDVWKRPPYATKFSFSEGKTDAVLIPVHMKSNRGGEDVTKKVRADEAKTLIRNLGAVQQQFKDDDLVILGDCNCLKADELSLRCYELAGFRDLNAGDDATWIKSPRYAAAPFDRFFVPDDQPEFTNSKLRVFKGHHFSSEFEFRKKLSDHYMVTTDVLLMNDDD